MPDEQSGPTRSPAVEALFDVDVVACELHGSAPPDGLIGDEAAIVDKAGAKRRNEFTAGRLCARLAMSELGHDVVPLLVDPSRAPSWPPGLTGSITHTAGLAVAVVAESGDSALGVDAEVVGRVDASIEEMVLSDEERHVLDEIQDPKRPVATTAVFAAKEAFYKAQWPLTSSWVGFTDVMARLVDSEVVLTPRSGLVTLGLLQWPIHVRYFERAGVIVAGCIATNRR